MGKTMKDLEHSRKIRADFVREYGVIPTSILRNSNMDKGKKGTSKHALMEGRGYTQTSAKLDDKKPLTKRQRRTFKFSGSAPKEGALSTFPQNVGRTITKFYSKENDIVYDPFAGHNSRMQMVWELNRCYIGVDISKQFMKHNQIIKEGLFADNRKKIIRNQNWICLLEESSDYVKGIADREADFTITSPPYWCVEKYTNEAEQLGKCKTYNRFMKALYQHIWENARILKEGAYCCWFVNDFVWKRTFYPYHADIITHFLQAGFTLHTIYIVDLGTDTTVFLQEAIKQKRFRKVHEYCLVFRKGV